MDILKHQFLTTSLIFLKPNYHAKMAPDTRKERRPREGADDGADSVARGQPADCVFNLAALYPAYPIKRLRARREHRHPKASKTEKSLPPLTH